MDRVGQIYPDTIIDLPDGTVDTSDRCRRGRGGMYGREHGVPRESGSPDLARVRRSFAGLHERVHIARKANGRFG